MQKVLSFRGKALGTIVYILDRKKLCYVSSDVCSFLIIPEFIGNKVCIQYS